MLTVVIGLVLLIPIFTILFELFKGPGESWGHIVKYLLGDYIAHSFFLVVVVAVFSLILGVVPAWLLSRYSFPFHKTLEWSLILPLAIPNYLMAYAYAGVFDYNGPASTLLSFVLPAGAPVKVDIMNIWGLAFILSVSLYPYVYVTTRSFFVNQSASQISAGKSLGAGEATIFWRVALPMARPAIAGGLFLVLMEVLNDYGAAYYYGVSTFTTAIFRSWFALEEPGTAVYLSALLCLFVFGLILVERFQRRNKGYQFGSHTGEMQKMTLSSARQIYVLMICSLPLLIGFVIPIIQMMYWSVLTAPTVWNAAFLSIIGQSFLLAGCAAILCICLSYVLIFGAKWSRASGVAILSKMTVLGYAVPGAVIAIGILIPGLAFDRWLIDVLESRFGINYGFVINGTVIGLLFAYSVRFLAVSYNPLEANFNKMGANVDQAAQVLGASTIRRTLEINLPLLKKGFWAGSILVFVDVLKELPLTLLLKPYGVTTLATKAYEYASDERVAESALPSLVIVAIGMIPIFFLNKLIRN